MKEDLQPTCPPPLINFSGGEQAVFDYLCAAFAASGIGHLLLSFPVAIVVRTFSEWLAMDAMCREKGRTQNGRNSWAVPSPWAVDEARLKMELGHLLPKIACTVGALSRAKWTVDDKAKQGDLFSEAVDKGVVARPALAVVLESPVPPPMIDFSSSEKIFYDYLCAELRALELEHMTSGLALAVVVRTYSCWVQALAECERKTRVQVSGESEWAMPAPWAQDEVRLKTELIQWLAKLGMTVPSLMMVRREAGEPEKVDDLFARFVSHAINSPAQRSMH